MWPKVLAVACVRLLDSPSTRENQEIFFPLKIHLPSTTILVLTGCSLFSFALDDASNDSTIPAIEVPPARTYIRGPLEVPAFTPPAPPLEKPVPVMRIGSAVTVPRHRFKERIRQITSRNRGHNVKTVIDELNLYPRLAQLLQAQFHLRGGSEIFAVDQAAGEVVLLETMEAATLASPALVSIGSRSRQGAHGDAQPQRLLADLSRHSQRRRRMSQNEIVRFALNNRWLEEQGVPDMNAPAARAALKNAKPDRMDGGTESKPSGSFFTTGKRPQANWNRPVRSRTQGGVGLGS